MHKSDIKGEKWTLYLTIAIAIITTIIAVYFLIEDGGKVPLFIVTFGGLAYVAVTLWNSESVMGLKNAVLLKLIVFLISFSAEVIGVNKGWIFGSYYYTFGFQILGVPLIVILMWDVIIYASYMLIYHIVNIRFRENAKLSRKIKVSAIMALLTGFAATSIDLVMDPISVSQQLWVWRNGGSYFPGIAGGVPIGNYLGWFAVVTLSIFLFKLVEKPFVEKKTFYLWASISPYIAFLVGFGLIAYLMGLYGPLMVSGFAMLSFLLMFYIIKIKEGGKFKEIYA